MWLTLLWSLTFVRITFGKSRHSEQTVAYGSAQRATEEMPLDKNVPAKQGQCNCKFVQFNMVQIESQHHWNKLIIYSVSPPTQFFFYFLLLLCRFCSFHICVFLSSLSEKTFRECLLSRLFVWHLIWLSVMQLRHYLFIGTLNPMLQRLTEGEPSLGKHTNTNVMSLSKQ